MSLSQALSTALSGVNTTQRSLSVIAGNVANANTPGYIEETANQVEVTTASTGTSVASAGIDRNLDKLLQSQLWTESSGNSYANAAAGLYQQLQQIYGTPGSSTSFDAVYNNFTSALQTLSTSPSSFSAQSGVVSSAQALTQNLNAMTASVQQLRTQAEQGIAGDVQTVNGALQQIAQINGQLNGGASSDAAAPALEDQRDQAISQLAQMMNIRVVENPNNQISVFTGTGQQLVNSNQASQLQFDNPGMLTASSQWSADPSADGVGTITLVSPSGTGTDLIATNTIQSGELAAYVQMRDSILPQAQSQLDEFANQMAQALSNQTTAGTAVTVGSQNGFNVNTAGMSPGNSFQFTYTDGSNTQHAITVVSLGRGGSLPTPPANATNQTIGLDFSGGLGPVVAQLNAAFGTSLQFSNSGSTLQVVNANATPNVVNSLSVTTTATSLTGGSPELPLFVDGASLITGATAAAGSQTTGLAGRISVNAALATSPSSLITYAAGVSSGDPTRPNFMLSQLTSAALTYSPSTGIGSQNAPFSGTLTDYLSQLVGAQSRAANAATNLQQGQNTVVTALQQRFNDESGVNIDTEMSNLITLQNAYSANARVMTTVQQMLTTLMQTVQ
jgi:flagellar hook-associated protein 1